MYRDFNKKHLQDVYNCNLKPDVKKELIDLLIEYDNDFRRELLSDIRTWALSIAQSLTQNRRNIPLLLDRALSAVRNFDINIEVLNSMLEDETITKQDIYDSIVETGKSVGVNIDDWPFAVSGDIIRVIMYYMSRDMVIDHFYTIVDADVNSSEKEELEKYLETSEL